jgi:magnesium-transporting ATPase (P-type)
MGTKNLILCGLIYTLFVIPFSLLFSTRIGGASEIIILLLISGILIAVLTFITYLFLFVFRKNKLSFILSIIALGFSIIQFLSMLSVAFLETNNLSLVLIQLFSPVGIISFGPPIGTILLSSVIVYKKRKELKLTKIN